ncbi:MAG: ATP-binding protein [Vicinamibacterales bacterium]
MPFRDLVGHRRLLGLLSRSIAQSSLPPSLIFSGPDGVGKLRAAVATAQALNCLSPVTTDIGIRDSGFGTRDSGIATREPRAESREASIDACGACAACTRIARGAHPDVQTIAPGEFGSIKIEQVRDAIESAVYRPFEGRRRVFLIEDAESLVAPAQNALLKTLEEPRPASVFILITSMADSLLPTVRSRCARLRFGRLTPAELISVLTRDHRYSEGDARAVAALADGSVGRALALRAAEYVGARHVAVELLRNASSSADARARLESAKSLSAKGPATHSAGSGSRSGAGAGTGPRTDREQVAVHLQVLSSMLRDVSIIATGADTRLLANLDLESGLTPVAKRFDSARAVRAFTAVDRAQEALDRNVSPKVIADWLALQL